MFQISRFLARIVSMSIHKKLLPNKNIRRLFSPDSSFNANMNIIRFKFENVSEIKSYFQIYRFKSVFTIDCFIKFT